MIKHYRVVNALNWPALVAEVDCLALLGWRPLGTPIIYTDLVGLNTVQTLNQAMWNENGVSE